MTLGAGVKSGRLAITRSKKLRETRRKAGGEVSLDKKDFRGKLSLEAHEQLVALADLHDKDISDYGSYLLERALLGEAHVAKLYVERVARWGKSGIPGESPGIGGKAKNRLRGV